MNPIKEKWIEKYKEKGFKKSMKLYSGRDLSVTALVKGP
jgi:transposase